MDGAVTLFSPRLGGCVGLEGAAAQGVASASPTDPLLRLAALDGPLVGAHLGGGGTGGGDMGGGGVALADALAAHALTPPAGTDPTAWRVHHRVRGHLVPVLAQLAPEAAANVSDAHAATVERHLRALSDLLAWAAVMDAAGIAWMVVKGPAVAARYARPSARTWNDLDLLVAPADLGPALAAVEAAGWHLADRNLALLAQVVPSEVHVVAPSGTVIDLHWALTSTRVRSRGVGVATAALLGRAGAVDLGGVSAPTPGDADTLVHLCVHAAASGAQRLGWLADVAAVAPRSEAGWAGVVEAAREWGACAAVAGTLVRTAATLPGGFDAPGALLAAAALRRGARAGIDAEVQRVVDARYPPLGVTGDRAPGWRLARSWVGLGPRPARLLLGSRRRRAFVDTVDHPGSALHPSGSRADLERFLADVAGRDGAPERR